GYTSVRTLLRCNQRAIHGRKSDKQHTTFEAENFEKVEEKAHMESEEQYPTWTSKFHQFFEVIKFSTDFTAKMHKRYDMSYDGFRRWAQRRAYVQVVTDQAFNPERHANLGPDLSAATFIVNINGKVQFNGMLLSLKSELTFLYQDQDWVSDIKKVPDKYHPGYKVTAIDASDTRLVYEGIENLMLLPHLKQLNVSKNTLLDDWFCDLLSRMHRHSHQLEVLNLTDCRRITERGIAALVEIPSLRKIIISGTEASREEHLELLTLLFNDINPDCNIVS
ncbi:ATP synthase subunit s-like protein, partial [Leptotrombidium deliense]